MDHEIRLWSNFIAKIRINGYELTPLKGASNIVLIGLNQATGFAGGGWLLGESFDIVSQEVV